MHMQKSIKQTSNVFEYHPEIISLLTQIKCQMKTLKYLNHAYVICFDRMGNTIQTYKSVWREADFVFEKKFI